MKDKYQLSMVNHEKGGPPARKSHCRIAEQPYFSHKEILGIEPGYKYSITSCQFDVGDSQET
jgi:hypothetical protein